MSNYELEIKQILEYPLCRMYRQFIQSLIRDRNIRTNGGSGLFYYTVLCNFANYRTSHRHIDGILYAVCPGEWIVSVKELAAMFRTHFHRQAIAILDDLQSRHLINYKIINRNRTVKYQICDWRKHNTMLDYTYPCQKDTGFFFFAHINSQRVDI